MASIFLDKSKKPDNIMLSEVLGETYQYWEEIKTALTTEYGPMTEEWKFYSGASGWTMKLLRKKRNLFFFSPQENYFMIAFVFGKKAVAEVEKSTLPKTIIQELITAKQYVEGRGVRIDVKKRSMVKNIITLTAIKVNN